MTAVRLVSMPWNRSILIRGPPPQPRGTRASICCGALYRTELSSAAALRVDDLFPQTEMPAPRHPMLTT